MVIPRLKLTLFALFVVALDRPVASFQSILTRSEARLVATQDGKVKRREGSRLASVPLVAGSARTHLDTGGIVGRSLFAYKNHKVANHRQSESNS